MSFDAMSSGDYLAALDATREAIVADIAGCESMRDKASLYLRLESTLKLIHEARPTVVKEDGIDEIARRRASRRPRSTKTADRAKRSG